MLVCWWRHFDWHFARPIVIAIAILVLNKILYKKFCDFVLNNNAGNVIIDGTSGAV